jgi:multidrug efflux pump subunit AcrA (membrane-fusion protein)
VQLGPVDSGYRVVASGLAVGERVIVDGVQRVRPGIKVVASAQPPR